MSNPIKKLKAPRKGTFRHAVWELLTHGVDHKPKEEIRYRILAHELTHDGQGWYSNDRFQLARSATLDEAVVILEGRWHVFKANYATLDEARVCGLSADAFHGDCIFNIEAEGYAFADVEVTSTRGYLAINRGLVKNLKITPNDPVPVDTTPVYIVQVFQPNECKWASTKFGGATPEEADAAAEALLLDDSAWMPNATLRKVRTTLNY